MQDCDLEVIGFEAGKGKFEGTLGALVVDYKGTPVGVGSGLSDGDRRMFWDHQDEYLGRVVTIQYFEETHAADGKPSIRFPVFKELREAGKEVSYS
jgi:DNA ligase-1